MRYLYFLLLWHCAGLTIAIPTVLNPFTGIKYEGNLSAGVESFLNIRFGEDTGGANRFALPKPFHYPPESTVNASVTGAGCPQANITTGIFKTTAKAFSEDCLTLRVDRLQNTTANSRLPVMIYFYGGGFTSGEIYDPYYNPTGLLKSAAENETPIIYAAVNYRLGFFGFASTPALTNPDSLNAGLYDQRLGIEWVESHIHHFGGDPDNITIFGQSAGAISIGHQINAFGGQIPVPFHRAIMQSGTSTSSAATSGDICTKHTAGVAHLLNCTSANSSAELECMRSIPFDVLLPIVDEYELSIDPNALSVWQPIAPSRFIPDAPSKLLRSGRFARDIDIINGWNENDGTEFIAANISTDSQVIKALVSPATFDNATAQKLLALYPLDAYAPVQSGNDTATAQFFRASQMSRDTQFLCAGLLLNQVMMNYSSRRHHVPSTYLFDLNTTLYTGQFEEKENTTYLGVAHGSDIAFVFNTVSATATATNSQKCLADMISASWASFATGGDVSGGKLALKGWIEGNGTSVRVLGGPGDGMVDVEGRGEGVLAGERVVERCAFWNEQGVLDMMQK